MRIIKLGIISVVLFFLLMTVISLFIPGRVRISKAINIHTTPDKVWNKIDDFSEWRGWNPMINDSSGLQITNDGSARVGPTNIRWIKKDQDEHIAQFSTGRKLPVQSAWKAITYQGSDSTTLHWYMDFNLRWYPWEKFSSLMLENSYGPFMEKGLLNLKKQLEE